MANLRRDRPLSAMHVEVVQLFQMLVEAGAQPGTDFSCDLEARLCRINERGFQLLQRAYPDLDWSSICDMMETDLEQPGHYLNAHLGVDFVGQMLARLEDCLVSLDDAPAASYVQQVLTGVEQRTGVPLYLLLQQRLSLSQQARLERLMRHPTAQPCYDWIIDLVLAAGGELSDATVCADDILLTQRGLELLSAVWIGDYDLSEDPQPA
ncbi:hypothetical protein IQ241_03870 [Romeria aff. gracilis LEGE 07310]|uniref:Uncharacterized protein n=1 Tax=Vasconcelosia minhoensis LEGE 07310 TaxID=915328 RepID=A0A8J7AB94_9CYAN|nr:hypothetical protein [Romeria gracilis]MBE9076439.1 hypothetical protein [Romeria aff. gracilis LEGE 07310]